MQAQQKSMMRRHVPVQRGDDPRTGCFQSAETEIGQTFGVVFAPNDGLDHRAATHPKDVADDAGEFQIGVFEDLLQPERVLRNLADQLLPGPGQIAR